MLNTWNPNFRFYSCCRNRLNIHLMHSFHRISVTRVFYVDCRSIAYYCYYDSGSNNVQYILKYRNFSLNIYYLICRYTIQKPNIHNYYIFFYAVWALGQSILQNEWTKIISFPAWERRILDVLENGLPNWGQIYFYNIQIRNFFKHRKVKPTVTILKHWDVLCLSFETRIRRTF